jgi:phosphatidylinositol-3-phosphatase
MAGQWEVDSVQISSLADAQYPQFSTNSWQFIFPHNNISSDGDIHNDMAVDASGTGSTGNNAGESPIIAEVINATSTQLTHLKTLSGHQVKSRGIFRVYTEHGGERHFEIHPVTEVFTWNGSAWVLDTDTRPNITTDANGTTHSGSTLQQMFTQNMTAQVMADNTNVILTFTSPNTNYGQFDGLAQSGVLNDSVSSYFWFTPTNPAVATTVRCRLVTNTAAAFNATSLASNHTVTVNILTRWDMLAISNKVASLSANQSSSFPAPLEFITLSVSSTGLVSTLPVISNVQAVSVSNTSATIQWITDVQSDSRVLYGTSPATVTNQVNGAVNVTNHVVSLTGLQQGTLYYFSVSSTSTGGTTTDDNQGAFYTFTTIAPPTLQTIQTVFLILMENENWASISGNAAAPYINHSLLPMASHAEQCFNPPGIHPSLPNYLWLEAGTNFGILADGDPSSFHQSTTNHLVTLLKNAGISWTSFQEDISGTTCPLTAVGQYAPKHNPMVYFDDVTNTNNTGSTYCISNVRPYTELATDLASNTVTRYNFITPNLCDDMHGNTGCPGGSLITQGDTWLSNNIPIIMNSQAYSNNGVIFVTWDEGEGGDGPIGMIVISSLAKGGGYSNTVHYTHSSTLRTMEEIFNVGPLLGDAANATDLSDLFAFGTAGQFAVIPSSGLTSSGLVGGPFSPVSQTYTLSNSGGLTLNWTASNSATWLSLSATSGTLTPGSNTTVTASINANANSLAANSYSDTISFTNLTSGVGNTTRPVTLTVNATAPVIVTNGSTLVSEGCTPTNGVIDPGEVVTVNFSVKNIGSGNTASLVATLVATNGVTSPSGPQTYGTVVAGGATVAEPFTFTANGACGGSITATLQLQDGANNLGTITYTLALGQTINPLTQNFDAVTAPALPAGWSTSASGAQSNWVTSTTLADTSPNAVFSPDPGAVGVNELDTPTFAVVSSSAVLTFRQNYSLAVNPTNLSQGLDGGVLEIKIGGGPYTDIVAAGGSFVSGGYSATIISTNGNPLAGRPAWSGNSGSFITTVVDLPVAAAGQNAQFRWLCGAGNVPSNTVSFSGALATWGFDASTPTADTVATNVTASSVTLVNATGSLTYFSGNPSAGKAVASSGFTSTAGPPTTGYSCFAFSLTITNGSQASLTSLSFDDRASGTGPASFDVQISQQANFSTLIYDSGTHATHAAFTNTPMNSLALTNAGLTGTVFFRIYGFSASGSGGTWRIDNLNIQGGVAGTGGATGTGWYIDTVSVRDFACCVNTNAPPPTDPFTTWQTQYFTSGELLNPAFSGPGADPFGKGMSNTNQFLAGFNPTNAAAYMHITRISGTNGGTDIRVDYLGASGDSSTMPPMASRTNVLEFTPGAVDGSYNSNNFASANVTNVLSGGIGLGTVTNMVDPGGATNFPARYYRVRVLVP